MSAKMIETGTETEPTRWIDNHCHLGEDADQWLADARSAGVHRFIDVGCDLETSRVAAARAQDHEGVFATTGLHPHDARQGLDGIEELISHPSVVAVGECGLDYHYDHSPRAVQREMFERQIRLANDHDVTLVIHTREAWAETFEILDREGIPDATVFHCFTGGAAEAEECLTRGGYLSYSGIVTFKSAEDVRAAVRVTPMDRILVETDSPYLAPVPHRGRPNQPAFVTFVGAAVAAEKACSGDVLAYATWDNAHRAYPRLTGPNGV